jgi:uncharacterized coiled-coil protein SlyX
MVANKPDPTIKKSQRKTTALTKKIERLTVQLQALKEKLEETKPAESTAEVI